MTARKFLFICFLQYYTSRNLWGEEKVLIITRRAMKAIQWGEQNDEEFNRLLMHTGIRWLSKDKICHFILHIKAGFVQTQPSAWRILSISKRAALRENEEVHDDDIQIYCDHLDVLQKDMQERFQDILKMKIPNWVIDPFSNTDEIEMELEKELIDLQTNEELKPKFKNGYHSF
ncbi:conserved hypothetical protein [Trichinella spiralis]|uniref:hypothetical protein n=1 Tax=Trichinella spiralis TaxID=6334 RepID=UPI0001EFC8BD|nr:conserved hypothetical protein [Trichinella spiralis]